MKNAVALNCNKIFLSYAENVVLVYEIIQFIIHVKFL